MLIRPPPQCHSVDENPLNGSQLRVSDTLQLRGKSHGSAVAPRTGSVCLFLGCVCQKGFKEYFISRKDVAMVTNACATCVTHLSLSLLVTCRSVPHPFFSFTREQIKTPLSLAVLKCWPQAIINNPKSGESQSLKVKIVVFLSLEKV
jgi:hypothetical protein